MKKKFVSFMNDFKAFAVRGNVLDLAVGVIIGGAFGKITSSLVSDMIMPLIGLLLGGINFSEWKFVLPTFYELGADQTPPTVNIGLFIQAVVDFVIIAFCVFIMIRLIGRLMKKEEQKPEEPSAPPEPDEQTLLLREIRDLLKNNNEA